MSDRQDILLLISKTKALMSMQAAGGGGVSSHPLKRKQSSEKSRSSAMSSQENERTPRKVVEEMLLDQSSSDDDSTGSEQIGDSENERQHSVHRIYSLRTADGSGNGSDDESSPVTRGDWKSPLQLRDNVPLRNEVELMFQLFDSYYAKSQSVLYQNIYSLFAFLALDSVQYTESLTDHARLYAMIHQKFFTILNGT